MKDGGDDRSAPRPLHLSTAFSCPSLTLSSLRERGRRLASREVARYVLGGMRVRERVRERVGLGVGVIVRLGVGIGVR